MPACLGMEVVLTWHAIAFAMAATPSNGGGSGLHSPSMALWDIKKRYMVCCLWTRCLPAILETRFLSGIQDTFGVVPGALKTC